MMVIPIGTEVNLKLPAGESKSSTRDDVLHVPTLVYNLLSVVKTSEAGKIATFCETQGEVIDDQGEVVAVASKGGSLYYLNCELLQNLFQLVCMPRRTCGIEDLVI